MRRRYHIGPGAASLVMIVVILCLTVLGILTWSSARADLRLSQRDVEMVQGYYQADARAQQTLAQVDQVLRDAGTQAQNWQDYEALLDEGLPEGVSRRQDLVVYTIDAGAQRAIRVALRLMPLGQGRRYQIESWAMEDQSLWEEIW